jgi:hypothetical protein
MRTERITLAGQEHVIEELPLRKNAAWRQLLNAELHDWAELMGNAQQVDATNLTGVLPILRHASDMVLQSPERIAELVFAYSAEMAAQREHIIDNAYESELVDAFMACVRLAFPFGRLTRLVTQLAANGSEQTPGAPTSTS